MEKFSLFKPFFKGYGQSYIWGVLFLMIINAITLWIPKLTGAAIDTLSNNKEGLSTYILYFIVIMIIVTYLKYKSRSNLLGSIRQLEFLLRRELFRHALAIPATYYEKNGPGKVMALMTNDVTSLRVSLGLGVMIVIDVIFFALFAFVLLAQNISLYLASIILLPMPFISIIVLYLSRSMRKRQRAAQATYSDLTEYSQELFLGMHVIRSFNRELTSLKRFNFINKKNYENNLKVALVESFLVPLTFIAPFICFAIDIYVCGQLILAGQLTIGEFVSINGYIMLLIGPIMGLGTLNTIMQKGLASLDRLSEFLSIEEEPIDAINESRLPFTRIQAKRLSFAYENTNVNVLQDINFDIKPGQFIGIVGAPGSGKSTLFKLLLRLQTPNRNTLFIGDKDILDIPLTELRRSIAYVPPVAYVLGGTIAENIKFGEKNAESLSLEIAAQRAALTRDLGEKIKSKEDNLYEGGQNLSGGQKQRINIARGLFKNAQYILMDDSFSALDGNSANLIIKTLREKSDQTLLFISQRLEALVNADEIWVFKEGKIIERGTHEALIALQGEYVNLYNKQISKGGCKRGKRF